MSVFMGFALLPFAPVIYLAFCCTKLLIYNLLFFAWRYPYAPSHSPSACVSDSFISRQWWKMHLSFFLWNGYMGSMHNDFTLVEGSRNVLLSPRIYTAVCRVIKNLKIKLPGQPTTDIWIFLLQPIQAAALIMLPTGRGEGDVPGEGFCDDFITKNVLSIQNAQYPYSI